jgi:hypothetical protein
MQSISFTSSIVVRYDAYRIKVVEIHSLPCRESADIAFDNGFVTFKTLGRVNTSLWREPPHVALANLRSNSLITELPTALALPARIDPASLKLFFNTYGLAVKPWVGEGKLYKADPIALDKLQFVLRSAWRNDPVAYEIMAGGDEDLESVGYLKANASSAEWIKSGWPRRHRFPVDLTDVHASISGTLVPLSNSMELVITGLRSLLSWQFLHDCWKGGLCICSNNECFTPYFVQRRKGQKYCSHDCAMVIATGNYRKKARAAIAEARKKGKWSRGEREKRTRSV